MRDNKNIKIFLYVFYAMCAVSLAIELFLHKSHTHFDIEKLPFFYAAFGFIAFVFIVLFAKHIVRPLFMRDEDYYDR